MSWIVYTLYKLSLSVYGYVLYESVSCVCLWLSDEPVLFCIICMNNGCIVHMFWMAPGKISCKLTGSPSLNKVFWIELNWIEHRPMHYKTGVTCVYNGLVFYTLL